MSRLVSRAENWERVYTSFQNINFAAFDYDTIKQSILNYIKLYFPESFNDFIESSELVAIVESFAYIAELIAYRLDMDAHENFISTAQRKESILRLAKLVSYSADRPLPARGLVKITSVSTTEGIIDALGNNLANKTITWNDTNNNNWKDQFVLVMNRILSQQFGTVSPSDRFQVQDVLFELYNLNTIAMQPGIFRYSATINGRSVPLELVPVEYDKTIGITERRPYNNSNFSILYGQDGLGDASETTGFLCFTKQGTLQRFRQTFDGITPNQYFEVPANDVNNTDIWLNNVDPLTGEIVDLPALLPYRREVVAGKSGEWVQVDTAHAQNVIFNTNPKRNKYEVETRDNNRVRLIFGDGEFADIPSGTFDVWVRTSLDQDIVVSQSAVINVPASFTYIDTIGRTQTLSFTFSLINSLQNGSASETLEHIRTSAPSVYYAQDRMVNGNDYNTFLLQDSTILKLRTVNRTFAGDSRYISWHDPSTTYENVKIFGDDGAIYYDKKFVTDITPTSDINTLITTYIEPLLSSTDIFLYVSSYGVTISQYRRKFNSTEIQRLTEALTPPPSPANVALYYNIHDHEWYVVQVSNDPSTVLDNWPDYYISDPLIQVVQTTTNTSLASGEAYEVTRYANRLIFYSPTTKFWNNNQSNDVIDYETLNSNYDNIVILQANPNSDRTRILDRNWNFNVMAQEIYTTGLDMGLPDISKLSILPMDENGDSVPDHLDINEVISPQGLANIIKPKMKLDFTDLTIPTYGYEITLPVSYITGFDDVVVLFDDLSEATKDLHWKETTGINPYQLINLGGIGQSNSPTGLINGTTYNYIITVDGVQHTGTILGNDLEDVNGQPEAENNQTLGRLITQLNEQLHDYVTINMYNNNIKITSKSADVTAEVSIGYVPVNDLFRRVVSTIFPGAGIYPDYVIVPEINVVSNTIILTEQGGDAGFNNQVLYVLVNEYVYFTRTSQDKWEVAPSNTESIVAYATNLALGKDVWDRKPGRFGLNFAWFHRTPRYHLIDPAPSNLMDTFIIQKGYFMELQRWLGDSSVPQPQEPTPLDMRIAYGYLLDNRMLSDTIVLHPGKIKLLFGSKADPTLQATIKVIKSENVVLTDNQIKSIIVTTVRNFFDPTLWEFGETFYFTELTAAIHAALPNDISSVVLVPTYQTNQFGNLYQVTAREDEIFYPDITVSNIEMVLDYNNVTLRVGTCSVDTIDNTLYVSSL